MRRMRDAWEKTSTLALTLTSTATLASGEGAVSWSGSVIGELGPLQGYPHLLIEMFTFKKKLMAHTEISNSRTYRLCHDGVWLCNLSSYHYSLGKVGLDSKGFKVITEWNYAVGVF